MSQSLARFENNVTNAETVFRQSYLGLRESCPVSWLKNLESQLLECLLTPRSVIPDEVATVCDKLEGIEKFEAKRDVIAKYCFCLRKGANGSCCRHTKA